MALTVYHYPNCSTCKRALAWLAAHDVEYTAIDIVKQPPPKATLAGAMKLGNLPIKKLFNVAGESYRAGDYKTKLAKLTDAQALAALAADGKLIKRPLVIGDSVALVGFDVGAWAAALT